MGDEDRDAIVLADASDLAVHVDDSRRPNPVLVYLESLPSSNSKRAMRDALRRVLRSIGRGHLDYEALPWWTLEPQHTTTIRARLIDGYGVNTAKVALAAVRGVLRQCFLLGYINQDRWKRVTSWQKVSGGDEDVAGRMLEDAEIARLQGACAASGSAFEVAMDTALLNTALGTGGRREEIAKLRVDDLSDDGAMLQIRGKRNKIRHQPLEPWVTRSLLAWLEQRARVPLTCGDMFVRARNGKVWDKPLSPWLVWDRLRVLGKRADVRFTPHDLRRTYISTVLDHADMVTSQKLAGHADPRTTARYDRRPARAKVKAVHDAFAKWGKQ